LDDLGKDGFLKEYLEEGHEASTMVTPARDQGPEVPVHGEINTISGLSLREDVPPPSEKSMLER